MFILARQQATAIVIIYRMYGSAKKTASANQYNLSLNKPKNLTLT